MYVLTVMLLHHRIYFCTGSYVPGSSIPRASLYLSMTWLLLYCNQRPTGRWIFFSASHKKEDWGISTSIPLWSPKPTLNGITHALAISKSCVAQTQTIWQLPHMKMGGPDEWVICFTTSYIWSYVPHSNLNRSTFAIFICIHNNNKFFPALSPFYQLRDKRLSKDLAGHW